MTPALGQHFHTTPPFLPPSHHRRTLPNVNSVLLKFYLLPVKLVIVCTAKLHLFISIWMDVYVSCCCCCWSGRDVKSQMACRARRHAGLIEAAFDVCLCVKWDGGPESRPEPSPAQTCTLYLSGQDKYSHCGQINVEGEDLKSNTVHINKEISVINYHIMNDELHFRNFKFQKCYLSHSSGKRSIIVFN